MKLHSAIWAYRVAYKTAIGTTPFNMVYGLDAILPIEFLIPTLRVAKQLEWTGHELSARIEDIEKLDEFRLRAVAGMYAQKRRLKQFHDSHIINKQFQKGDLVLAYTLKQHTSKLKKRGMGPYLIHDLSPSGAVHLATLDGVPMANWISGCRLKKYKEPLTEDILKRLHATKERKKKHDNMKSLAKKEAKERAAKLRRQRLGIPNKTTIQVLKASESSSHILKPYILVEIGNKQTTELALIDTGADINAISHEIWVNLGRPKLNQSTIKIQTFSGSTIEVEGNLNLPIFIGSTDVHAEFVVMKPGTLTTSVILGQSWQRQFNGTTNWREEGLNFEVGGNKYFTPFFNEETSSQSEASDIAGQSEAETNNTCFKTRPAKQVQKDGQRWRWVPKNKPLQDTQKESLPKRNISHQYKNNKPMQRWVPKQLLQAQGYYQGADKVWLPKPQHPKPQTQTMPPKQEPYCQNLSTKKPQTKIWRAKPIIQTPSQSLQKLAETTPNSSKTAWRWVPKMPTHITQQPVEEICTTSKIQPSLVMQIKIRHLQVLLFGVKSLSQPYEWPTPFSLSLLYN